MEEDRTFQSFETLLREATQSVEKDLALEDKGWLPLGGVSYTGLTDEERTTAVKNSRLYFIKDPLARQAIRLWTDYTFGSGLSFAVPEENEATKAVMDGFWNGRQNRTILGAGGQRKSSDKLLVDGEIFFALFLGADKQATLRRIDPLEITEIITDPGDAEDPRYYKREWTTPQNESPTAYYRSVSNIKDVATPDSKGKAIQKTEDADALILHIAINTIGQRGNPLLLPAIDWIKQYRRFLASRVAIMLAMARFAWKSKIMGGTAEVAAEKARLDDKTPEAGAVRIENMGADLQPIKTDSGARNAYDDARLIKLQVSAAVGIPEQYWGDISTGNLATAKTVELPMLKQFQSNQQLWKDAYGTIIDVVLEHAGVSEDKRYVDLDFPPIAPEDVAALATSLQLIVATFPDFADLPEVQQVGLMALGIDDVAKVLEGLKQEQESKGTMATARAIRGLRDLVEALKERTNGNRTADVGAV